MEYDFNVFQMEVEGHLFWAAESKALKGCVGQGETVEEAIAELQENEKEWLETAREYHIPIPEKKVKKENQFNGKFALRISPFLHEESSNIAKENGISLNQYFNDAIAYYSAKNREYGQKSVKTKKKSNEYSLNGGLSVSLLSDGDDK